MAKLLVVLTLGVVGLLCPIFVEVYRHRSWVRHRDSGFVPPTGGLVLLGGLGGMVFMLAALLVILLW